jgi:hypothetical protein
MARPTRRGTAPEQDLPPVSPGRAGRLPAAPAASVEELRAVEMAWLRDHHDDLANRYQGQWIAVDGPKLVAHAGDLATLLTFAAAKGHPHPLVTAVRADPNVRLYV